MDWLERFRDKYPHIIWINPSERPSWGQYWCETYDAIARVFPMFPLTVDGLEAGMKTAGAVMRRQLLPIPRLCGVTRRPSWKYMGTALPLPPVPFRCDLPETP